MDSTSASPGKQNKTPEAFMQFFRNTEKLNQMTPDDRTEIFRTVLLGSSDLTQDLLNEILRDYSVEQLEVSDFDSSRRYASFRNRRFDLVNENDTMSLKSVIQNGMQ